MRKIGTPTKRPKTNRPKIKRPSQKLPNNKNSHKVHLSQPQSVPATTPKRPCYITSKAPKRPKPRNVPNTLH
jgi:hypothetical protein